ncbi:hypothetical protein K32_39020 [Kaistia sp. 32K]|uniref:urease accessory protein UreE n=1 Tax=Kaistia sp. 32K TaxID=2795690 RepID=UPI001936EB32|nr:urease accessory protein UreE [Kaistia sp. 32K]BCP55285.1 hypothetical protein K32_39020 [Kaistia sp. 32K]
MIRATSVLPAGTWAGTPADTVLLDYEARHRRRLAMSARGGVSFLLDLPAREALHHGDGLLLEDGRVIAVEAAAEPLADISAETPAKLVRLAWLLGNQQLPAQLLGEHLRIRRDPVVEAELAERGARIMPISAPFDPEEDSVGGDGPRFWHSVEFTHGFSRHAGFSESGGSGFAEARGQAFASSHSPSRAHSTSTSESHSKKPGSATEPDGEETDPSGGPDDRSG